MKKSRKNNKTSKTKKKRTNIFRKSFLREGTIPNCVSSRNKIGGSIIFKDGQMTKTDETFDGKPFFRKVFYYDETSSDIENKRKLAQVAEAEIAIVNILMNNHHRNIATYYQLNKDYVEMEKLNTRAKKTRKKIINTMKNVKDFLQSLGIMYIDWKDDNIGIAKDGTYKLFDFDVSGLVDLKTNKWIVKPVEYWSYKKAIENGCKTPKQIDDFAFNYGLIKK
jgi:serine/threonine protein kinase